MRVSGRTSVRMKGVRAALLGALLPVMMPHVPAVAQETQTAAPDAFSFDIPAGPLGPALSRFALVTDHQLLAESHLVAGVRTRGVEGRYAAEDGLRVLLAGTGLEFSTVDTRTHVLARRADAAGPDASSEAAPGVIRLSGHPVIDDPAGTPVASAYIDPQEVILVTGSRFERAGRAAVLPVQVIGRAALETSGAIEIGEMIASQSPATLEFSNASTHLSAQNAGLSSIGLRGLGTTRTLVLIDGRRTVANSGNASRFGSDTIPAEFVERVEISTGGASAVYGSDAIAGVVNFVLIDSLEGGRLLAQAGMTQDGGGQYHVLSATQGWRFGEGRGRLLFNVTRDHMRRIGAEDRDWAQVPVSLAGDGETLEADLSSYTPGGRFIGYDFWYDEAGLQTDFDIAVDGYDTRSFATISVPRERDLFALKLDYDFDGGVSAYFTGLFSHSESLSTREAQTAYYNERFGLDNERIGMIPVDHPFVPEAIRQAALSEGLPGITWRRRFSELGEEYRQNDRTTQRFWAGLQGEAGIWSWDVALGHGRYDQDQLRSGEVNYARIRNALDIEADPANPGGHRCADPTARAAGCAPLDMFGVNAISAEAADYIRATDRLEVEVEQWTLGGSALGDVALPDGRVISLAWGAEHRVDSQRTRGDAAALNRETGYVGVPDLDAVGHASEVFAEALVPVVPDRFDVTAAVRLAHYDIDRVGLVGSYRLGGVWSPSDALAFRGQISRAQRAPSLTELYSGPRGDYDTVSDPCHGVTGTSSGQIAENCRSEPGIARAIAEDGVYEQTITSVYAPNSGNPDLEEERSDAVTLGLVYTPVRAEGLSLSVDLYDIRVSGAISSLSSRALLSECYGAPVAITANRYCADIQRGETGQLLEMQNRVANLNEIRSAGADVTLDYAWQMSPASIWAGDWDLRILYAYTDRLEQVFEGSDGEVSRSVWDGEVGAPHHRWTARLGVTRGPWLVQWRVRYEGAAIDGHDRAAKANAGDMLFLEIDPWMQHDLHVRYLAGADGRLQIFGGINNVFHDYGPFLPSGTESGGRRNFSPGYDAAGRRVYAGIRARW